jgi:hypothetical protein
MSQIFSVKKKRFVEISQELIDMLAGLDDGEYCFIEGFNIIKATKK